MIDLQNPIIIPFKEVDNLRKDKDNRILEHVGNSILSLALEIKLNLENHDQVDNELISNGQHLQEAEELFKRARL